MKGMKEFLDEMKEFSIAREIFEKIECQGFQSFLHTLKIAIVLNSSLQTRQHQCALRCMLLDE